jgi:hypothetical protein
MKANPFPGLRSFESNESHLFFGRDGQSEELLQRLQAHHFVAVVGSSGSGKSSIVRAGLLPALHGGLMVRAGAEWRVAVLRPGSDPIGNLAEAIVDENVLGTRGATDPYAAVALTETSLRQGNLGLVDVVRQARRFAGPDSPPSVSPETNLLIVVDQFEELFRFRREVSSEDASAFVKLLLEAVARRDDRVFVILTIRSDFLGDCSQFIGLPEAINKGQYLVPRMTRTERKAAITGPIGVAGATISHPLINQLLNDVGDDPDQLPALQHALMRTWDRWSGAKKNGEPIDREHYESIGGIGCALSMHAEEAFAELSTAQQDLACRIFEALTEREPSGSAIRRPRTIGQLHDIIDAPAAEIKAVIETFRRPGRSFLMPPVPAALEDDTLIDISHESLIRGWERLAQWVEEEGEASELYRWIAKTSEVSSLDRRNLVRGARLEQLAAWRTTRQPNRSWAIQYHPEFERAMAFLDASEENQRREEAEMAADVIRTQLSARRRLQYAVVMTVLFLISVGTTVLALVKTSQATDSERKAINSAAVAAENHRTAQEYQRKKDIADSSANVALEARARMADTLKKKVADLTESEKRVKKLAAQKEAEYNRAQSHLEQTRLAQDSLRREAAAMEALLESFDAFDDEDFELAGELMNDAMRTFDAPGHRAAAGRAYSWLAKRYDQYDDSSAATDAHRKATTALRLALRETPTSASRSASSTNMILQILVDSYSELGRDDSAWYYGAELLGRLLADEGTRAPKLVRATTALATSTEEDERRVAEMRLRARESVNALLWRTPYSIEERVTGTLAVGAAMSSIDPELSLEFYRDLFEFVESQRVPQPNAIVQIASRIYLTDGAGSEGEWAKSEVLRRTEAILRAAGSVKASRTASAIADYAEFLDDYVREADSELWTAFADSLRDHDADPEWQDALMYLDAKLDAFPDETSLQRIEIAAERAVKAARKTSPESLGEVVDLIQRRASILVLSPRDQSGEMLFRLAIATVERHHELDRTKILSLYGDLCNVYQSRNEFRRAQHMLDSVMEAAVPLMPRDEAVADFRRRLAMLLAEMGLNKSADTLYREALAIYGALASANGVSHGDTYLLSAINAVDGESPEQARADLAAAERMYAAEKFYREIRVPYVQWLRARLSLSERKWDVADAELRQAYEGMTSRLDVESRIGGWILRTLAEVRLGQGRHREALELIDSAIHVQRRLTKTSSFETSPDLAKSFVVRGRIHWANMDLGHARAMFSAAANMYELMFGADSPLVAEARKAEMTIGP